MRNITTYNTKFYRYVRRDSRSRRIGTTINDIGLGYEIILHKNGSILNAICRNINAAIEYKKDNISIYWVFGRGHTVTLIIYTLPDRPDYATHSIKVYYQTSPDYPKLKNIRNLLIK